MFNVDRMNPSQGRSESQIRVRKKASHLFKLQLQQNPNSNEQHQHQPDQCEYGAVAPLNQTTKKQTPRKQVGSKPLQAVQQLLTQRAILSRQRKQRNGEGGAQRRDFDYRGAAACTPKKTNRQSSAAAGPTREEIQPNWYGVSQIADGDDEEENEYQVFDMLRRYSQETFKENKKSSWSNKKSAAGIGQTQYTADSSKITCQGVDQRTDWNGSVFESQTTTDCTPNLSNQHNTPRVTAQRASEKKLNHKESPAAEQYFPSIDLSKTKASSRKHRQGKLDQSIENKTCLLMIL